MFPFTVSCFTVGILMHTGRVLGLLVSELLHELRKKRKTKSSPEVVTTICTKIFVKQATCCLFSLPFPRHVCSNYPFSMEPDFGVAGTMPNKGTPLGP